MDPNNGASYGGYGYGDAYAATNDPNESLNYGWPAAGVMSSMSEGQAPYQQSSGFPLKGSGRGFVAQGGSWAPPPTRSSFPRKNGPPFGWKNNVQKKSDTQKRVEAAGKLPAMLLHELFRNVTEDYQEVQSVPKKYRCNITINGQQFSMEAANKKAAKHRAAELALRSLRPDLQVKPYEEGITTVPTNAVAAKRPAAEPLAQQHEGAKNNVGGKKIKLSPLDSALSLLDFFRKLCSDAGAAFAPVFDCAPVGKTDSPTDSQTEYTVTLSFPAQQRTYTRTGKGKAMLKDLVIREALQDFFKISDADIRSVIRRNLCNKIQTDIPIVQTLHIVCDLSHCDVKFTFDTPDNIPLGTGPTPYIAVCKIIDHSEGDKEISFKSEPAGSKHEAKERAALHMLRSYFEIDPVSKVGDENQQGQAVQGPCQILNIMWTRRNKKAAAIKYDFTDLSLNNMPNFLCFCEVEGEKYQGEGRSKKLAKNAAATEVLRALFKYEYSVDGPLPPELAPKKHSDKQAEKNSRFEGAVVSPLCTEILEFSKQKYYDMCSEFRIGMSTQMACFFLVNEKNEKRLLSIGSSAPTVIDVGTLTSAKGNSIVHLDPLVLARRGLVRYLMSEVELEAQDPTQTIFLRGADNKLKLRPNYHLVLYANYPPNCSFAALERPEKRLSYLTRNAFLPTPDEPQTLQEVQETSEIRINSTADKVFKWSVLGVQGALLSTLMHPILPTTAFFGHAAPVSDESLKFALFGRLGEPKIPFTVESKRVNIMMLQSEPHLWYRSSNGPEVIDCTTGRTTKGAPSKVCKSELFEEYRKLKDAITTTESYEDTKARAHEYQLAKNMFYEQLQKDGFGAWQKKPKELVDFTFDSLDVKF
ncbi:unnamed protein product [Caenorhabditis auriculariae]|uniref:Uncharacterized protein n=1 Tax=Caenorhabditis auriculariae TaxID=2777116 RepID=A0A8S1HSU8_9PELO|nr:unnamed protein product [Caenorhabditis auriculariae]